ncbi:PREDICTED: desmoglein-2-like [Cyprinodon variegatus]|uniref:desmoglein-2-like n=1 Tax=Cyprinodon variegatus TaxID=28743 RepID=UPI0007425D7D|nr:PREDICTED: desmoglein-2-like [Cyprinodon variegatus]
MPKVDLDESPKVRERATPPVETPQGQETQRLPSSNCLFPQVQAAVLVRSHSGVNLLRHKRAWVIPPTILRENVDYTQKEYISRIRFDLPKGTKVRYELKGKGADQYPFHVFVVDEKGLVRVTKVLDREQIPVYNITAFARREDGSALNENITLQLKVEDDNDNPPRFDSSMKAEVDECIPEGTSVLQIKASDADDPETSNAQIAYSIIDQKPHDHFKMTKDGLIYVDYPHLDREEEDTYILTVTAADLYGAPGGHTTTGTVTITLNDVNDNPPTLEKSAYEGSIEENKFGVEVMRIKAQDNDLDNTENWEAVFDIVKGNEDGYFSIKTDPKTNEGILVLEKAVDFEKVKTMDLGLVVRNKAPPFGSSGGGASGASGGGGASGASGGGGSSGGGGGSGGGSGGSSGTALKTYPIKINVKNQPDPPHFDSVAKAIPVTRNQPFSINNIVARYPAIDGDTGNPAKNVTYLKANDPLNWLSIDPQTAEIKLTKDPYSDPSTRRLVNGTYFAEILCITDDMPAKTATGTIAIEVQPFNDHCPKLTTDLMSMCTSENKLIVNAEDEDAFPFGAPFNFSIDPDGTQGSWQVKQHNETAAIVQAMEDLWPGVYKLMFVVEDQQGKSCPESQKLKVSVCVCKDGDVCKKQTAPPAKLVGAGIGLLFLGLLLLLLIPLLMCLCQCGSAAKYKDLFTDVPYSTKSHLIHYDTEPPADNVEAAALLTLPTQNIKGGDLQYVEALPGAGFEMQQSVASMNQGMFQGVSSNGFRDEMGMNMWEGSGFGSETRESRGYHDLALPDSFLSLYYIQKTSGDENVEITDTQLVYDYEGEGSPAGSVGCCSLLDSDNDLSFLDDFGPRFKTLAEICGGKIVQSETTTQAETALPNVPVSNVRVSEPDLLTSQEVSHMSIVQSANSRTEQRLASERREQSEIRESKAAVKEGMTSVQAGMAHQNQMVVLNQQQPVYFTTAPMMQPMHYVVQQPLQNAVILAEAPASSLQHMVMVNGTDIASSQGVIVQGQTMMPNVQTQSLGAVLVYSRVNQGTTGNLISGSQNMMFVESNVPAGSVRVLNGNQVSLAQGGATLNGLSGSQTIIKKRESNSRGQQSQGGKGSFQKSEVSRGQKVHVISGASGGSEGSTSSYTLTTSTNNGVVVGQKPRVMN